MELGTETINLNLPEMIILEITDDTIEFSKKKKKLEKIIDKLSQY